MFMDMSEIGLQFIVLGEISDIHSYFQQWKRVNDELFKLPQTGLTPSEAASMSKFFFVKRDFDRARLTGLALGLIAHGIAREQVFELNEMLRNETKFLHDLKRDFLTDFDESVNMARRVFNESSLDLQVNRPLQLFFAAELFSAADEAMDDVLDLLHAITITLRSNRC